MIFHFINQSGLESPLDLYNFTKEDYLDEPIEIFNPATIDRKIIVFIIFFVSLVLNIVLLMQQIYAYRIQNQYSNKFALIILNLTVSNILVCCFCTLKGFVWMLTFYWLAGRAACKLLMFMRTFSLYLNSFSVVTLLIASVVTKKIHKVNNIIIVLILIFPSWLASAILSIPQAVIFDAHSFPNHPDLYQCLVWGPYHSIAIKIHWYMYVPTAYLLPLFVALALSCVLVLHSIKTKTTSSPGNHVNNTYEMMTSENDLDMNQDDVILTTPKSKPKLDYLPIVTAMIYFTCWMPYIITDILVKVIADISGPTLYFWAYYVGLSNTMFTAVVIVIDSFIGLC